MPRLVLDTTLCIYSMDWKDKATGLTSRHYCQEAIQPDKLPPYRMKHGVCHRHEGGLAGWNPNNCIGPCCKTAQNSRETNRPAEEQPCPTSTP